MERCRCSAPCLLLLQSMHSLCDAESLQMLHSLRSGLVRSVLAQVHRRRSGASVLSWASWMLGHEGDGTGIGCLKMESSSLELFRSCLDVVL